MFIAKAISNCMQATCEWAGSKLTRAFDGCARTLRRVPAEPQAAGAPAIVQRRASILSDGAFRRPPDGKQGGRVDQPLAGSDGPTRVVFHAQVDTKHAASHGADRKATKLPDRGTITADMNAYVRANLRTDVLCAKSFLRGSPTALDQVAQFLRPRLAARLHEIARQILEGCIREGVRPPADRRSADFTFDMTLYRLVKEVFQSLNPQAFDDVAVSLVREIGRDLQQQIESDVALHGNSPNDYGDLPAHGAVRFAIERIAFRLLAETLRSFESSGLDAATRNRIASTFQAATNRAIDFARLDDKYFTRPAPDAPKVLTDEGRGLVAPVQQAHAEASKAVFDFFAQMLEPDSFDRQVGPAVLYS